MHDNLRISVTDRCNIRCFYCMPENGVDFVERSEILDFEEIERFARIAVRLGMTKLRVTGGEPLVRRGLPLLIRAPGGDSGRARPGSHHQRRAAGGAGRAALRGRPAAPQRASRHARPRPLPRRSRGATIWTRCWPAWRRPSGPGYTAIKLNAVAVKNLVEPDIVPLARFGRERGFEVRYIEFMPLDAQNLWDRGKVLLADEIIAMLSREIAPLQPVPDPDPRAPATEYAFADGIGKVGFIASVSRPFCGNCNRLRLTADGKLRYCLFALEEDDVKTLMRSGARMRKSPR